MLHATKQQQRNVKLVNNEKSCLKCISKSTYMSRKIFENNSFVIRNSNLSLNLNKPTFIGMRTLELGKLSTYEFHYDYIKNNYGNISRLLFTDSDSLMYEIKTEDF